MKKRFALSCLLLFIAPIMMYGMDSDEECAEREGPESLLAYAKQHNLLKNLQKFEQRLKQEEARMQKKQPAEYQELMEKISLVTPTFSDDVDELKVIKTHEIEIQAQIMMLATGVGEEAHKELTGQCESAQKRAKQCRKRIEKLEAQIEQLKDRNEVLKEQRDDWEKGYKELQKGALLILSRRPSCLIL